MLECCFFVFGKKVDFCQDQSPDDRCRPQSCWIVFYFICAIYRTKETNINAAIKIRELIIIQIINLVLPELTPQINFMHRFKPNLMSEPHETSSLLLSHIKDQQFYSTLSTITLQLAKEVGVENTTIQELVSCFAKVKGSSNSPMLALEKQNNLDDQNIKKYPSEHYDLFQKEISFKQQVNFLNKMETQLVHSRQKQSSFNSLNKYAAEKQSEMLPLLMVEAPTKNSRFKDLLSRNKKSKICTSQNYFKLDALDLLKNAYQNSNECYTMMRSFTLLKTVFGHSMDEDRQSNCPLYNVLFDQSQNLIISGGEQGAIKIWSKQTGLLLSSLKGHQEYINKLEVTKCNKYICSSAGDGIRFFQLKDMTTLGGWKAESIIEIASIYDPLTGLSKFMFGDKKNLYVLDQLKMLAARQRSLTKQDFMIYKYSHKISKQSHILIIQISHDHKFVLLGFESGDLILFHYKDLFTIDPIKAETEPLSNCFNLPIKHLLRVHRDQIRQLKWHPNNQNFVSGGKQGYCLLWEYKNEKVPTVLKEIQVSKLFNRRKKREFGCNFISFNCTYSHFVAGFMELIDEDDEDRGNGDVIVYSLQEKQVIFEFSKDMPIKVASVRGMDTHPVYPNIAVVCEGTGRIIIIDFILKSILNTFELRGFHLLHPHFSLNPGDCRFSKDGKYFVVSTQFGSISVFGYDLKNFYETCPSEQFFANDFTSFTVNQKMQPIPIEGDFQIDMNRLQRGQIRKIRGDPHEKQLTNNFQNYWSELQKNLNLKPINHKNTLVRKGDQAQENTHFSLYLSKIKYNLAEVNNFNHFYSKNLEEIEATKQSILYDERQKQSRVFRKVIEQKLRKNKGQPVNGLAELTHDLILEQIDAKGKRGGRRLTKMGLRQNYPNYKDQNFDYDSVNQEEYNVEQENPDQEDLNELDYNENSSDQIPRTTRRNNLSRFTDRRHRDSQTRYNIRTRPAQNYNYDENEEEQQKVLRSMKRRTPAEDIEDMLKDEEFRNYDMSQGRKKRKRNRINSDEDDEFIHNDSEQSEYAGSDEKNLRNSRRSNENTHRRRGRPRKFPIPQVQVQQQESQPHLNRLRRKQQKNSQENLQKQYEFEGVINPRSHARNLRTRQQDASNGKNSSTKKKKQKDLGQCYRCAVKPAVVECSVCECACCQTCKSKRGKQVEQNKFRCFICMYINSPGTAIVDQNKISQGYYRMDERSLDIYVPQIEDQVRFFFQGYEDFLAHTIKNLNSTVTEEVQDYLLMPHIYNEIYEQALLETPLCKVKDIKYFFPFSNPDVLSNMYKRRTSTNEKKQIHMLLNLEIVLTGQKKQTKMQKSDFWIFYIPGHQSIDSNNQYILREQIYQFIEQNKVIKKLSENQTVKIQGQDYQIVQIGAAEDCFPESIWKLIKVSRSQNKRLRHMSKQAEKRCNVWNLSQFVPQIQYLHNYKPQMYQKKILDKIKHIRQNLEDHVLFEDYIDFQIYPFYRTVVQVGICLTSIQERVKNNYYRSLSSLQFDLDLMVKNTIEFNGEDNDVTRTGNQIRKEILKVLNATEDQINKFNIAEEGPKKQKRTIKKKQLGHQFVTIQEQLPNIQGLRSLRNTRTRNNGTSEKLSENRRHKKSISDESQFKAQEGQSNDKQNYEHDDISNQKEDYSNKRRGTMRQRASRQKSRALTQKADTTAKSKKYDKIIDDDDKEQEIYKNRHNQNQRNKSRFIDNSYDSQQKNSAAAGPSVYSTRRSSRLKN